MGDREGWADRPPIERETSITREVRLSRELPRPPARGDDKRGRRRAGYTQLATVLLAAAALVISVVVLLLTLRDEQTPSADGPIDIATQAETAEAADLDDADSDGGDTVDELEPASPTDAPVDGPWVRATLVGRDFMLDGVVPTTSLAGDLLQSAETAYSPFVRSTLTVDEQLEEVEWLAAGADAIVLLPLISDGSLLIAEGRIELTGRSPSADRVDRLTGALAQLTGLPVEVGDMEITGLAAPDLLLDGEDGRVVLSGRLPSEEIRRSIVSGAIAAYGQTSVTDQITVDPGVFTSLWMFTGDQLLQAMSAFPDYELKIVGSSFSGFINGGVTFETGSAEFSGNYAQVLDVGVAVLTRDQSLQLVIEGHTDGIGPDDVNLDLSQRRAEAVLDYFVDNGIAPERLTAIGKGETEPVAPNDTPEGQARNRRIVYRLTSSL
ncbi:MAG: OmpA family protein [Acidimicrobiia bacterium]|nr:OmpA family protein [Acidimicrobiia bacterium]